jgi:diacylglycerol O-acyltransferase / wax synthase
MARVSRLSPLDAAFLYFERPHQRMHVGCLALLDGPIAFDAFAGAMAERLGGIARYRQRPVRPVLDVDWPRWEDDSTFDVRRHLRHVAIPAPGGDAELHELVDTLFATPLDRRHPLWETYLIDGLAGGRAALLCKVHHAMIDGVSGAQVLEAMSDPVPRPATNGVRPVATPAAEPTSLFASLRPSALLARARDAVGAAGTLASLVLEPASTLPFNAPITDARHIAWASFPLDDFLALRGVAGCKVNDVVLAVIAGALRSYLTARGLRPEDLRVRTLVPVSMRRAEDHMTLGNLVSAMFPRLPVDVADPVERLHAMSAEMRTLKERGQPRASGVAMQIAGMLPAPLNALLARALPEGTPLNTVCTNVPGPRDACRILGRTILEVHPIVPLFSGMGLEFAILSYAGRLSICAAVDPHLVPDADDLPSHLHASLAELREAIGGGAPAVAAEAAAGPRVADLMSADVIAIGPEDSLAKAYRVMRLNRIRHLPVVDHDGRLIGLVTHRDVLAASSSSLMVPAEEERVRLLDLARAADVMETHVSIALPVDPAADAGERMIRHKIGCLPVVETSGRLAGIVTEEDFLRWATARMAPPEPARASA